MTKAKGLWLNLGCGDDLLKDFCNVDLVLPDPVPLKGHVQQEDLRKPWVWLDSSIDFILAKDIIEHLPDKIHTMNEAHRVLKPGGQMQIVVPTTDGTGAFQDPTHVSFWNRRSFLYYEAGNIYRDRFASSYGVKARFKVLAEDVTQTDDGPRLSILLEAVK
jgi:SAM-dependent methyltransferase